MDVYLDSEFAKKTEEAYRELVKMGIASSDVQFTTQKDAESVCPNSSCIDNQLTAFTVFRGKRSKSLFLLHSRPPLALQARYAPPLARRLKRCQPTNHYACDFRLLNSRFRRMLDRNHTPRLHQNQETSLRNQCLHSRHRSPIRTQNQIGRAHV